MSLDDISKTKNKYSVRYKPMEIDMTDKIIKSIKDVVGERASDGLINQIVKESKKKKNLNEE